MHIIKNIYIDPAEIQWDFIRSSGPGGQNVNKVSTAVQLRFDVMHSPSLPADIKQRLVAIAGKRLSQQGILIIEAKNHRTQERNRQEAIKRLKDMIIKAAWKPKARIKTKPTAASKTKRLESKKKLSEKKTNRGPVRFTD